MMHATRLAIICAVLLALGAGIVFIIFRSTPPSDTTLHPIPTPTTAQVRNVPPGFLEYRNERYGISFFYPKTAALKTLNQGLGAMTIVIEDASGGVGFQLFIVPYTGEKISNERFKQDMPSGVRENETTATIDGVPAVAFFSRDPALGDTREVWFIHGGYLFEVTTLKSLDSWLIALLATWRFEQ